ncbi:PIN domain-containing protein, partial [Arthrobacter sp. JCM 19049]
MAQQTELTPRTYVLDTSVLLSDPHAIFNFAEHPVVIPLTVVTELEHKRKDLELGYFARQALRNLDDLIQEHGGLGTAVPVGESGGSLRIELNNIAQEVLPVGMRSTDNDSRILAVAKNILDAGLEVALVTKDLPMRIKASAIGIHAEVYRSELTRSSGWSGIQELELDAQAMAELYESERLDAPPEVADAPVNTGLVITSVRGSALGRKVHDGSIRLVRGDREAFG